MVRHVVDELGRRHALSNRLGRGGQGEVFATAGGRFAVKRRFSRTEADRVAFESRFQAIRRLPLDGIPIAIPLALLKRPHVGYVMTLMTDTVPIESLILVPPGREDRVFDWYVESGGLRRRLRLLAHAAEALAMLHGQGLAYGDLSAGNVLVSQAITEAEVWLIDSDNVAFLTALPDDGVFTPDFAAPELVTGDQGVTTLSDAFAFAILAFRTLSLVHPFHGDAVEQGPPDVLEQARVGQLPWIEHPNGQNSSSLGLRRGDVLSTRLFECFGQAFQDGLLDRTKRPGLARWADLLHTAADNTVICAVCRAARYRGRSRCPWCGSPPPESILLRIDRWEPEHPMGEQLCQLPHRPVISAGVGETISLSRRVSDLCFGPAGREVVLHVEVETEQIQVHAPSGHEIWLQEVGQDRWSRLRSRARPLPVTHGAPSWYLHFGPRDTSHRVASLGRSGATS